MKVSSVMTREVVTVHPEDSVQYTAGLLTRYDITSLPVVDDENNVIGIVSETDLLRGRLAADPRSHLTPTIVDEPDPPTLVREVMTPTAACMAASSDTADVAALMLETNVRAVPIVDGAALVGIVSRRDLLRTLLRDDEAIHREVVDRLEAYSGETGRWPVTVENGIVTIGGHVSDEREAQTLIALARTVDGVLRVHVHAHKLIGHRG